MRILVDLLHPAHVHVFRNLITTMRDRGDEVLITARDKDVTIELLAEYDLDHVVISSQSTGTAGLAGEWALRSARLSRIARTFKPDVMTGIMGVSIAPVGKLIRTPSVVFYDTEFATTTNRVIYPLSTAIVTPDCYSSPVNGNHIIPELPRTRVSASRPIPTRPESRHERWRRYRDAVFNGSFRLMGGIS